MLSLRRLALLTLLAVLVPAAPSFAADVVISEFRARGSAGGNDEFVELVNRSSSPVDISGYRLSGCASASPGAVSSRATVQANTTLPAGGHFLFTNTNATGPYDDGVAPDQTYATGFSDTGSSGIHLANGAGVRQDSVGLTASTNCLEGTGVAASFPAGSVDTNVYRRKNGGVQDTENNAADFDVPPLTPDAERCGCAGSGGGGAITKISAIQGSGFVSPLAGQSVTIEGVVVGIDNEKGASVGSANSLTTFPGDRGLYVQEEPADADASAATSEGIFVGFVDAVTSYPVGTRVRVTGTAVEQFGQTQINEAIGTEPLNLGPATPVQTPAATTISESAATTQAVTVSTSSCGFPGDVCANGRRDYYETLEGMLVELPVGTANAGGTNKFGELFLTPGTATDRVLRTDDTGGPGGTPDAQIRSLLATDGDGGAANPLNPLIAPLDSTTITQADLFDRAEGAAGPLGYSFSNYKIVVQPGDLPTVVDGPTPDEYPFDSIAAAPPSELRVASFNVENFFPVGGPLDGTTISAAGYEEKISRARDAIDDLLERPDVVAVQEVVNKTILDDLATRLGGYTAFLEEGNDNRGIDVGYLIKSTLTPSDLQQLGKTAPNPTAATCSDIAGLLFDRPPLAIDVAGKGLDVTVITNHFSSKAAPDTCRDAQAAFVRDQVASLEAAGRAVVVTGDLNAFEDETPLAAMQAPPATLTNLWSQAPADNRYSFQFSGRLQTLDHILVTDDLDARLKDIRYAHFDNDYFDRQSPTDGHKVSDHDPPVLTLQAESPQAPPTCAVTALRAGPPKEQDVTVQDAGSGLQSITNIQITNGTVNVAPFIPGTTSPVVVTATKDDQTKKTVWSFHATDAAGNVKHCG